MLNKLKLVSLLILLSLGSVSAAPLTYAITDSSQFGTLDLGTETFSLIGHTSSLFGLANTSLGLEGLSENGILVRINPANAAETIVGDTTLGNKTNVLGTLDGTLFTISTTGTLYTINPATGALVTIGSTGIPAFDPDDSYFASLTGINGSLYYTLEDQTTGFTPKMYKINPANGSTQLIGAAQGVLDAALYINGTYYAVSSTDDPLNARIFSVNSATGAATALANVGSGATTIFGIAAVPEPGSLALMGLGVAALGFGRRFVRRY